MTLRRLAVLALLVLGTDRVDAQRRVVPEPRSRPRRARVVSPPPPVVRTVAPPAADGSNAAAAATPIAPQALTVTLVTFGSGPAVWERFGHNALWIHDGDAGTDIAYNWGLFDFEQPGFFQRFLTGDTKYWMAGEDAFAMISAYQNAGRTVTLQTLNLTPEQARTLNDLVLRNAREENKYYRYDYYRDNCSTRLRDAVDRALGGALRRATDTVRTTLTYRGESVRLTEGDIPIQAGIDIALGRPADAPLSSWESFFIPMRLRDAARVVRIPRENGEMVPLVASERRIEPSESAGRVVEARTPPDHARRNLTVGALLAAIVVMLGMLIRAHRWAAWMVALLGAGWSLLCGTLGVVLLLAWVATKHAFWAQNENLLVLSPIALSLVVLLPAAVLAGRSVRRARIIGAAMVLMGLGALALALTPGGAVLRPVVALFLPMNVALAWVLWRAIPRRIATSSVRTG
ncbi:MAG: DUF4105 domain-containing protein [Gemmatimonadaceae bacterium]